VEKVDIPEVAERPLPEKITIFDAEAATVRRRSRPDSESPLGNLKREKVSNLELLIL
jgi:hypothetical protein